MQFLDLLIRSKEDSKSQVCVGLDLATFGTREQYTLDKGQKKVAVLLNLIEKLHSHCSSFKINRQYILDLSLSEIQHITQSSHDHGKPIIIDHKLSDIGSTNQQAMQHFAKEGFDAFTASPFPGNTKELCETAHNYNLAVIMLTLMSNPGAIWMKEAYIENIPIFQYNARLANEFADGVVIGATGHVINENLLTIKSEISGKVVLAPGVGAQGGDVKFLVDNFQEDVIFNVGRSIIYRSKPLRALQSYNDLVKKHTG
ncbi:MAG: orotidine 5'-phosphate decarboxylase [Candidatus Kariarchaeaceae archaeon]|jgi:orotidine-5'-phosphate decarboxylase